MTQTLTARVSRAAVILLSITLAWVGARAQEGAPAGAASTRGDRHSEGWSKAMRLKGPSLPPKFPKVGQEIERVVLENGLIVYLQEDHRLPLLDVSVLVRAGTYYEPPEELRTAAMAGELLRRGGTKNYPPDALDGGGAPGRMRFRVEQPPEFPLQDGAGRVVRGP